MSQEIKKPKVILVLIKSDLYLKRKTHQKQQRGCKVSQWERALELVRTPNTQKQRVGMCECLFPFTEVGGILASLGRNLGLFLFRN